MAQLIKLKDYISRYEWNPYRYPTQYIRLKQDNWNKLYEQWKDNQVDDNSNAFMMNDQDDEETTFNKFKSFFQKESNKVDQIDNASPLPETELELRRDFLNRLYPFQLKWATSTVTNVSFMDKKYEKDTTLKYFLQRFPDIYLIMYYPIFNIKKAPIDGEVILISPIGIEIIYLLEDNRESTYMASDERTWAVETNYETTRQISPLISLRRTEQIVKSILNTHNIDFKINKLVLSRTNQIVFTSEPYKTKIIGKHEYEDWFQEKRKLSSPLKNEQLKVAETLLGYCLSNSIRRPEWEDDNSEIILQTSE